MSTRVGTVLPDKALVRQLVDTLCYSKGGPLPDWDDVYDSHCGMTGDILEERKDLGCVQLSFSDGHKYWYPMKALTKGVGNGRPVQSQGKPVADLVKAKLLDITRRCLGEKVDVREFVKTRLFGSKEEEDWAVGVEALFKQIAPQISNQPDPTRPSDFHHTRKIGELERDLSLAHKLIHKLQEERRVDFTTLEQTAGSSTGGDTALHEIIRLIRNENEELRLQLSAAEQSSKIARKEASELGRQGKLLENTLKEQAVSVEVLRSEVEEKRRKERDAPLLDFKSLRSPTTSTGRAKRRANTPPARIAGNAGMRRAATTATSTAKPRGPTFSVVTTRSLSPGTTGQSRTPIEGSKKITRSESLSTRGRRSASRRTQSPDQFHFGGVTFTASGTHDRPRRYERSHTTGSVRRTSTGLPPPPPPHDAIPTSRALKYDI